LLEERGIQGSCGRPRGEGVSEQDIMANVNGGKMRAAADDGTFRPLTMQHGHSRAEWTARNP